MTEYPTSAQQQGEAALEHLRSAPGLLRLTPGQRDRIVREVRAERGERRARPADRRSRAA